MAKLAAHISIIFAILAAYQTTAVILDNGYCRSHSCSGFIGASAIIAGVILSSYIALLPVVFVLVTAVSSRTNDFRRSKTLLFFGIYTTAYFIFTYNLFPSKRGGLLIPCESFRDMYELNCDRLREEKTLYHLYAIAKIGLMRILSIFRSSHRAYDSEASYWNMSAFAMTNMLTFLTASCFQMLRRRHRREIQG